MIVRGRRLSTKGMRLVNKWLKFIQFGLFPPRCVLCGADGQPGMDLCSACEADLARIDPACPACGLPLSASEHSLCGSCLQTPPPFQRTVSPFYYAPPLAQLITRFKFNQRLLMARVFAGLLAKQIGATHPLPECIIPVPLHPRRLRERGYNQALEIARLLGKALAIPVDYRLCQRIRYTAPQTGLAATQRRRNVRQAFGLTNKIPYRHVAILDDVITTGHTVSELARLLRRHGVAEIEVWSVARAVPDR